MAFAKKTTAAPAAAKAPAKKVAVTAAKAPAKRGFPARKTGAAAGPKKVRPPKITFNAPADMKPCFIELMFRTQEDGLIGPKFKAIRVRGNWTNPEARRYDMMEYDAPTVAAMLARISARTFSAGLAKRLPANATFRVVIRAGKRAADDTILSGVKSIARMVKSAKTGKGVWKEMTDVKDPVRRKIRSVSRFLPGAFVNIQLPPTGRKPKAEAEE